MALQELLPDEKQLIEAKALIKQMKDYKLYANRNGRRIVINDINKIIHNLYIHSVIVTNNLDDLVIWKYGNTANRDEDIEWHLAVTLTLLYLISTQGGYLAGITKYVSNSETKIAKLFHQYNIAFIKQSFATYKMATN